MLITRSYTQLSPYHHYQALLILNTVSKDLQYWFWQNNLLLNPEKSKVIYLGTRQRRCDLPSKTCVAGCDITSSDTVKTLGVTLDSTLSFQTHDNNVVRSCNFHLCALRHIRRSLHCNIANTIACCIVGSKLDYCNSLLFNIQTSTLQKLQRVQNNLARVVCDVSKFQQPSEDLLHELHWLPIRQRIHYKIATITYRALHLQQPSYISSLLVNNIPPWTLRSTSQGLLNTPCSQTVIGARRFSSAAPVIWNKLSYTVRSAVTIGTFHTRLKTHLFPVIASYTYAIPLLIHLFVKLAINIR